MLELAKHLFKRWMIARLRKADARMRSRLTTEFGGLPPALWGCSVNARGHLAIGGNDVADLANAFGTPLHVVDLAQLGRTHNAFIAGIRRHYRNARLATSYKTNPVPYVLAALHRMGTDAEVISEFELWLALRLGVPGSRIIVNGPGKTATMIRRAVEHGVGMINIDGPHEIAHIAAAARACERKQACGVRVTTSVGWSSQFGLRIAGGEALRAFESLRAEPMIEPVGLHLHLGTGIKSPATYRDAVRQVLEFARALEARLGIVIRTFDLGGGFGVPTVRGLDEWDLRMIALGHAAREALPDGCPDPSTFGACIAELFAEHYRDGAPPEIVLEPGRAITSSAQTLLLGVVGIKMRESRRQVILDGGKNITMPLGWETHKIFAASRMNEPYVRETDLFGPLCHPGDIVGQNLRLPAIDADDVIAVMDAGAYFVPNQTNFSQTRPAIVAIESGRPRLVRARESFEDIVRLDECAVEPR